LIFVAKILLSVSAFARRNVTYADASKKPSKALSIKATQTKPIAKCKNYCGKVVFLLCNSELIRYLIEQFLLTRQMQLWVYLHICRELVAGLPVSVSLSGLFLSTTATTTGTTEFSATLFFSLAELRFFCRIDSV